MISSILSSGTGGRDVPRMTLLTSRRRAIVSSGVEAGKSEPTSRLSRTPHSVAIRIVGEKAWDQEFSIDWTLSDSGEQFHMELSNGALIHHPATGARGADLAVTLTRPQLIALLAAGVSEGVEMTGDAGVLGRLQALTDAPDPDFAIVTP